ncbi:MAG: adenosylcobalamin-dependent ribonucleoside-diphosphate reductase [Saprospiraceae bacterium]
MIKLNEQIIKTQYSRHIGGELESVEELINRVVHTISSIEGNYNNDINFYKVKFKEIIINNYFIPSGRILNNSGSKQSQTASCFVLPISDDFLSIFDSLKLAAICHKFGGGTGFNFSKLREKGAVISSSEAGGASGPVSWIKLFNSETDVVMSGGKMRGANMGVLSVYHPDILEFIKCKGDYGLKNFNISVLIDDDFMHKLLKNENIQLISPLNNTFIREESAQLIWNSIIENIYKTGEPGILFIDEINRSNKYGSLVGLLNIANPCGEQIMYENESSFLGSINLLSFYDETNNDILWKKLEETIYLGTRFLDNTIDSNKYPSKEIEKISKMYRRIGLGVMGFADLLVKLNIPYDSNECLTFIDKLGSFFKFHSLNASKALAEEKGSFSIIENRTDFPLQRNIAVTAIAPTGTISMVANCSSGIEPKFGHYFNKNVINNEGINYVDQQLLQALMDTNGFNKTEAISLIKHNKFNEYLTDLQKEVFKFAYNIPPIWHVKVLAQWQKYIDNGISKTVNVPSEIGIYELEEVLKMAYESNCKGITIYRQGSHPKDLISMNNEIQIIQSKEKTKLFNELVGN